MPVAVQNQSEVAQYRFNVDIVHNVEKQSFFISCLDDFTALPIRPPISHYCMCVIVHIKCDVKLLILLISLF